MPKKITPELRPRLRGWCWSMSRTTPRRPRRRRRWPSSWAEPGDGSALGRGRPGRFPATGRGPPRLSTPRSRLSKAKVRRSRRTTRSSARPRFSSPGDSTPQPLIMAFTDDMRSEGMRSRRPVGCWVRRAARSPRVWSYYEVVLGREVPFPSLADVGFLLFPVVTAAGLLCWLRGSDGAAASPRDVMDGAVIAGSLLACRG